MQFITFSDRIKSFPGFTLNDIRKVDPHFHKRQLMDWLKRDYIRTFAGEYYILADQQIDEPTRFMLANRLYEPSYISLETALAYYQVIPEAVLSITSVSSRKTKQYQSDWGSLTYRSVKPVLMFGYEVIEVSSTRKYLMARPEKAVLDYLYLNPKVSSIEDFEGLRWNREELQPVVDGARFHEYLTIFDKQALSGRVDILRRYLDA
jgi:predicted transcriptional regulator of viral defense system